MLPVLTRHPPGKRTKPGCRAAILSARSLRSPFGRFLKVSRGKSETSSRRSVPVPPASTAIRPEVVDAVATNVPEYFVHVSPATATVTWEAYAVVRAASRSVTVRGVLVGESVRAQTLKSYVLPASSRTPVL